MPRSSSTSVSTAGGSAVNPGEYVLSLTTSDWSRAVTIKVPETLGVIIQVDDNVPADAFKTELNAPKIIKLNNVFYVSVTIKNSLGLSLSNIVVTLTINSCTWWSILGEGATSSKNLGNLNDGDSLTIIWQIEPGLIECTLQRQQQEWQASLLTSARPTAKLYVLYESQQPRNSKPV